MAPSADIASHPDRMYFDDIPRATVVFRRATRRSPASRGSRSQTPNRSWIESAGRAACAGSGAKCASAPGVIRCRVAPCAGSRTVVSAAVGAANARPASHSSCTITPRAEMLGAMVGSSRRTCSAPYTRRARAIPVAVCFALSGCLKKGGPARLGRLSEAEIEIFIRPSAVGKSSPARSRCDGPGVCGLQPPRDLGCPLEHLIERYRAGLQPAAQPLPFELFHDEELLARRSSSRVVDHADVRVIERRGRLCLATKTLQGGRVVGAPRDRNSPPPPPQPAASWGLPPPFPRPRAGGRRVRPW